MDHPVSLLRGRAWAVQKDPHGRRPRAVVHAVDDGVSARAACAANPSCSARACRPGASGRGIPVRASAVRSGSLRSMASPWGALAGGTCARQSGPDHRVQRKTTKPCMWSNQSRGSITPNGAMLYGGVVVAALLGLLQADRADREEHEAAAEVAPQDALDVPSREHQRHGPGSRAAIAGGSARDSAYDRASCGVHPPDRPLASRSGSARPASRSSRCRRPPADLTGRSAGSRASRAAQRRTRSKVWI